MKQRFLALLTVLACLLALAAPAAYAEEVSEGVTVHIRSVDDLRKLAADCAMDTYSDNMTVILDCDLDLSEESISPIPVFNGVFEGNHHRITGLRLSSDGSFQGLFRYLNADAEVRNLSVSGRVEPSIGREHAGGIAGANYGEIRNCSFDGTVTGLNYVGGLAGENIGCIINCKVSGEVNGKRFTGGIAGHNTGLITDCVNHAEVNTEINEATLDLEALNTVSTVPLALLNAEDENIVSDSGGIVGYSKGVLLNCVNHGTVGYQHYGYNVGGIAGRQAGYLSGCENYGDVLGRQDVAGIVGQMEPFLELVESLNLADELVLLNSYMNAASGDLAYMSEQMQSALDSAGSYSLDSGGVSEDLGGTISHAGEDPASGDTNTGTISPGDISSDNMSGVIENLNGDEMSGISDTMSDFAARIDEMYGIMSDSAGYLSSDLHLANDQFSRVLLLMSNALGGNSQTNVFEDVSGDLEEKDVEGRVSHNVNMGRVEADSNVGGIVGAMGIEYEFDLEGTLAEKVGANGIINNTYDAKCICADNVNRGPVLAKKDRVGGVVGSSEMGTVITDQSYGSVESSEGGYAGGIVGYAETPIRQCYAMCDIRGNQYVGGIVGYGAEILDCVSMVETGTANACLGAIAGWADMQSAGKVARNVYVHDSLGAVDGISYAQLAMPVSYDELVQREGLPDDFKALKLTFLADGALVSELTVPYGGTVPSSEVPAVPVKAGYSGAWQDFATSDLRFSSTVEAVYTPLQSALASAETREDSPLSIVLVEGEFDDSVLVSVEAYADAQADETVLESWQLRLSNLEDPAGASYRIRYQIPKLQNPTHEVEVQQLSNGIWRSVSVTENGSYVSFPAHGDSVIFRAVEVNRFSPKLLVLIAAAAVAMLGLIVIAAASSRHKKSTALVEKKKAPVEGKHTRRPQ